MGLLVRLPIRGIVISNSEAGHQNLLHQRNIFVVIIAQISVCRCCSAERSLVILRDNLWTIGIVEGLNSRGVSALCCLMIYL